jgi:prepilin-type N-terminal cleavage/methylation domain-containing protein
MAPNPCPPQRRDHGFSYVEVLIAIVIIAVCLVPALDALRDGVRAAGPELDYTKNQQRLKSCFEVILAKSFATLDTAALAANSSCSSVAADTLDASCAAVPDPLQPHPDPLLVTVFRYDGSPPIACVPTGTDTGLLWIKVAIEGSSLSLDTLKSRW